MAALRTLFSCIEIMLRYTDPRMPVSNRPSEDLEYLRNMMRDNLKNIHEALKEVALIANRLGCKEIESLLTERKFSCEGNPQ